MSRRLKGNADDNGEKEEKEEEDSDDNGVIEKINNEKSTQKKGKFGGTSYRRVKRLIYYPFKKFQKHYKRLSSYSSTSNVSNGNSSVRSGYSCCLCMSKPQTLDTDYDSIDPSDPNIGFEHIKSLIEENDFYCKECNTHFDY